MPKFTDTPYRDKSFLLSESLFQLDGVDDFIDFGNSAGALFDSANSFAVSLLFKKTSSGLGHLFGNIDVVSAGSSSFRGFFMQATGSLLQVGFADSPTFSTFSASRTIETGRVYHVFVVYYSSLPLFSVYLNGDLIGETANIQAFGDSLFPRLMVGARSTTATTQVSYFGGSVGALKVFDLSGSSAISRREEAKLLTRQPYEIPPSLIPHCFGEWDLNQRDYTSGTVYDTVKQYANLASSPKVSHNGSITGKSNNELGVGDLSSSDISEDLYALGEVTTWGAIGFGLSGGGGRYLESDVSINSAGIFKVNSDYTQEFLIREKLLTRGVGDVCMLFDTSPLTPFTRVMAITMTADSSGILTVFFDNTNVSIGFGNSIPVDGRYHQILISYEHSQTELSLYIDKVFIASVTGGTITTSASAALRYFSSSAVVDLHSAGVGHHKVYDGHMTPSQVRNQEFPTKLWDIRFQSNPGDIKYRSLTGSVGFDLINYTLDEQVEISSGLPPVIKALSFNGTDHALQSNIGNIVSTSESGHILWAGTIDFPSPSANDIIILFQTRSGTTGNFPLLQWSIQYDDPNFFRFRYIIRTGPDTRVVKSEPLPHSILSNFNLFELSSTSPTSVDVDFYLNTVIVPRSYTNSDIGNWWFRRFLDESLDSSHVFNVFSDIAFSSYVQGNTVFFGLSDSVISRLLVKEMWNNSMLRPPKSVSEIPWQIFLDFNKALDISGTPKISNKASELFSSSSSPDVFTQAFSTSELTLGDPLYRFVPIDSLR